MLASVTSLKAKADARQDKERLIEIRKKSLLILILHHLIDQGYINTAEKLQSESGLSPYEWEAADNIDLMTIVQEFEEYFEMKFNKKPKLFRRVQEPSKTKRGVFRVATGAPSLPKLTSTTAITSYSTIETRIDKEEKAASSTTPRHHPRREKKVVENTGGTTVTIAEEFGLSVQKTTAHVHQQHGSTSNKKVAEAEGPQSHRPTTPPQRDSDQNDTKLLKPLPAGILLPA